MRLLLVGLDDSKQLASMLRYHAVHVAADAEGALAKVREMRRVDAVICDLRSLDIDGPAFHAALVEARPELATRVVYLLSPREAERDAAFLDAHRTVLLPFDRADVERALMPFDPLPLL